MKRIERFIGHSLLSVGWVSFLFGVTLIVSGDREGYYQILAGLIALLFSYFFFEE